MPTVARFIAALEDIDGVTRVGGHELASDRSRARQAPRPSGDERLRRPEDASPEFELVAAFDAAAVPAAAGRARGARRRRRAPTGDASQRRRRRGAAGSRRATRRGADREGPRGHEPDPGRRSDEGHRPRRSSSRWSARRVRGLLVRAAGAEARGGRRARRPRSTSCEDVASQPRARRSAVRRAGARPTTTRTTAASSSSARPCRRTTTARACSSSCSELATTTASTSAPSSVECPRRRAQTAPAAPAPDATAGARACRRAAPTEPAGTRRRTSRGRPPRRRARRHRGHRRDAADRRDRRSRRPAGDALRGQVPRRLLQPRRPLRRRRRPGPAPMTDEVRRSTGAC